MFLSSGLRNKVSLKHRRRLSLGWFRDVREESLREAATKAGLRELELRLKLHIGGMIMALGGVLIAIKYFG
jgi:hypothetical protein